MSAVSNGQVLETLRRLQLLPAGQMRELSATYAANRYGDARPMVRELLKNGSLSIYQANQLLMGQTHELVVGYYHLLERLGQGGLSSVYKARHTEQGFMVALKVLRSEIFICEEGRQQFLQEIEAMAKLNHPNIVEFCDVDRAGDTFYFAMEFVDGIDLGKLVRLGGPRTVQDTCDYVRQTAMGLQHAHEHNIIHRDIKPVNLFLTQPMPATPAFGEKAKPEEAKGLIKILDWGLANPRLPRALEAKKDHVACKTLVGTADYLAPEQARDANAVDIRGDIYSLGCTFYYLLTGSAPFPDGALMQKIIHHQRSEPIPISQFREDVPTGVIDIVRRMMAKNPADRFQTPASLAVALLPFARPNSHAKSRPTLPKFARGSPLLNERDRTPLPGSLDPAKLLGELHHVDEPAAVESH